MNSIDERLAQLERLVQDGSPKEAIERLRRLEKRLTRFFGFMGFDSGTRKPRYRCNGFSEFVEIHSLDVSLKELLEVVPRETTVSVVLKQGSTEKVIFQLTN